MEGSRFRSMRRKSKKTTAVSTLSDSMDSTTLLCDLIDKGMRACRER
jgi:hypothetical protein